MHLWNLFVKNKYCTIDLVLEECFYSWWNLHWKVIILTKLFLKTCRSPMPLTSRERQNMYGPSQSNINSNLSYSADNILDERPYSKVPEYDEPPPKPPIPKDLVLLSLNLADRAMSWVFDSIWFFISVGRESTYVFFSMKAPVSVYLQLEKNQKIHDSQTDIISMGHSIMKLHKWAGCHLQVWPMDITDLTFKWTISGHHHRLPIFSNQTQCWKWVQAWQMKLWHENENMKWKCKNSK